MYYEATIIISFHQVPFPVQYVACPPFNFGRPSPDVRDESGPCLQRPLLVSHHLPLFGAEGGQGGRCSFMEEEERVSHEMEVSMLPTEGLEDAGAMPVCSYRVHSGAPDGDLVRYARVGDKLFHVWECQRTGPFPPKSLGRGGRAVGGRDSGSLSRVFISAPLGAVRCVFPPLLAPSRAGRDDKKN